MSVGQGNILVQQRKETTVIPPPGPPFNINSADNGLSVDPVSGRIVFGDNGSGAATWLSQRFTQTQGFTWQLTNVLGTNLFFDPNHIAAVSGGNSYNIFAGAGGSGLNLSADILGGAAEEIVFTGNTNPNDAFSIVNRGSLFEVLTIPGGPAGGNIWLVIDNLNGFTAWGDTVGLAFSGQQMQQDLLNGGATIRRNAGRELDIDISNFRYQFGDIDAAVNGSKLDIDDSAFTINLRSNNSNGVDNARLLLNSDSGGGNSIASIFTVFSGITTIAAIDGTNQIWRAFESQNGNFLRVSGFNSRVEAGTDTGIVKRTLLLDVANNVFTIGDVDGTLGAGMQLQLANGTSEAVIQDNAGVYFDLFPSLRSYRIGDVGGTGGGTVLKVDDSGFHVDVTANNGLKIISTGLGLTVSGDTTLIHTGSALSNNAGAALGTLANAPTAGNPTKWIAIDDNGTIRKIPTWL